MRLGSSFHRCQTWQFVTFSSPCRFHCLQHADSLFWGTVLATADHVMSRPGASSRSSFKCFSVRSLTCQAIFAGPSAEARAKAILKNQKKNGTALTGRAAVLKRTADLRRLSGLDSSSTDALVAAVGKPGQIFYTTRKAQHDCPLPKLPEGAHVLVATGPDARAVLLAYHAHVCSGSPATAAGPDAGILLGWMAPQQHLASEGSAVGSRKLCNVVVSVRVQDEPAGLLAMHLDDAVRTCVVQAIHVMPSFSGPWQFPRHMWEHARIWVTEKARAKPSMLVRFSLETSCSQSHKACHFWISRMGWDGSVDAQRACREYSSGVKKWRVGEYVCFFNLQCS